MEKIEVPPKRKKNYKNKTAWKNTAPEIKKIYLMDSIAEWR